MLPGHNLPPPLNLGRFDPMASAHSPYDPTSQMPLSGISSPPAIPHHIPHWTAAVTGFPPMILPSNASQLYSSPFSDPRLNFQSPPSPLPFNSPVHFQTILALQLAMQQRNSQMYQNVHPSSGPITPPFSQTDRLSPPTAQRTLKISELQSLLSKTKKKPEPTIGVEEVLDKFKGKDVTVERIVKSEDNKGTCMEYCSETGDSEIGDQDRLTPDEVSSYIAFQYV